MPVLDYLNPHAYIMRLRRAASDADLVRIMRTGIPGTGMPPNNLTLENAKAIVAYLHWMADSAASDLAWASAAWGRAQPVSQA